MLWHLAFATLTTGAFSQNYQWAGAFKGVASESGKALVADAAGNIYSIGSFEGIPDFDPGPGTYTLQANATASDIYISKLDAAGNLLWAEAIGGVAAESPVDIAADASGNIFILANYASTTIDADPGPGTYMLSSAGSTDILLCKLDASGNFVWAKSIGGAGYDVASNLKLDASGNIFVLGSLGSHQTPMDLDPGPGTYTLASSGNEDIFIAKLDASGNFLWAKGIGGTNLEVAKSIATDAAGNFYMTGQFYTASGSSNIPVDFDPGPGTFTLLSAGGADVFVLKLDATGNFGWAKQFGGTGSEIGNAMTVDANGNIYLTGYYTATADFDPGPGTYTLTSAGGQDIYALKLDASGNFVWARSMGGNNTDGGTATTVDAAGNMYIGGHFSTTTDFDPSPATYTLSVVGGRDIFVAKLDASGNFGWAIGMGSTSTEVLNGIIVNPAGSEVTITGYHSSSIDMDPGPGVQSLVLAGASDAYVAKYASCNMPASAGTISSASSSVCMGATMALSTPTVSGATSYSWTVPAGASIVTGQNTNSVTVSFGAASGTVVVTPSNTCGSSASASLAITVNPLPTVSSTVSPAATVCAGSSVILSGTGATTYTWTNGISNGVSYTPAASSVYTVSGTDANGCVASATTAIQLNPLPVVTSSASPSSTVCTGSMLALHGMGANTYTWTGGITNGLAFTPGASATYTVSGTDANGCVNTGTVAIHLNPLPAVSASASPSSAVCAGTPVSLSGAGATSYTWTNGITNAVAFTPSVSTSYTVTGTDANGCRNSAVANVTVNTLPALVVTTNKSVICTGQTAIVSAVGALSYTWSTGQVTSSVMVSPTITTNYTVSGTGANGCVASIAITQSVVPCTGIDVYEQNGPEVRSFPNPNQGEFTIIANADVKLLLFNNLGQVLQTIDLNESTDRRYRVSGLAPGVYFLTDTAGTKLAGQKIVVTP